MSDTISYYFDEDMENSPKKEEYSENVLQIEALFKLLSVEEKVVVKRIIAEAKIFN